MQYLPPRLQHRPHQKQRLLRRFLRHKLGSCGKSNASLRGGACYIGKKRQRSGVFFGLQYGLRLLPKLLYQQRGKGITVERLSRIFLELRDRGADNINLVTATHFVPQVAKALKSVKAWLNIPVIFNCGGYEKVESRYSKAPNYFETAYAALCEMLRQTGKYQIENGLIKKGVIVRHLILPGCYKDSMEIFRRLAPFKENILISLMRQYCPMGKAADYSEINRKLTTFEYNKVLDLCMEIGYEGFTQEKSSATDEMTPVFVFSGL